MGKRRCQASPAGMPESLRWALEFLPHYFSDAPCAFHIALLGDLEDEEKRLIARVAPRGHAKSTCAALAYPLWCVCEGKRRNILIITYESSLARQFVRDMRGELETNDHILASYGDLSSTGAETPGKKRAPRRPPARRGQARQRDDAPRRAQRARGPWSDGKLTTSTGITVQAKGSGAGLRGTKVGPHRPDLIICDDIEQDELVQTPEGRRKLERWLRHVVMPGLAPGGQLVVLGSLLHYDSLLANLRDKQRFPKWDYQVYRAIEAEPGEDGQFYRVALWPARWPLARLDDERERVGTLAFEQEYMANPIDDSIRVFVPERLRRYEPFEIESRADKLVTLMAVDPATGKQDGDYFAIWVGSLDVGTSTLYTRELTLERIGIIEQVQRIEGAFERWRPIKIGIETTAYQVALKDVLDDYSRKNGLYMPVVELKTVQNKRARIEGSSVFYENGTFRLPPALLPEAESQFLHFPKAKHDDAPDVCAMGIELARSLRGGLLEGARPRNGNPYARRGGW